MSPASSWPSSGAGSPSLSGPRSRAARLFRGVVLTGVVGGLLFLLVYALFQRITRIAPPAVSDEMRAAAERPVTTDGPRARIGANWISRERGVWEIHLAGEPYAMGYAQARLGQRLMLDTEDYMFSEMAKYIPSRTARWLVTLGVRFQYRHLADLVPEPLKLEMAGLARGLIDDHADFMPAYHRMVFYHALHDITQRLEHSPLLGCSAFAASGTATTNGHLIIGRNFDFEGPVVFDRDKAILFFKPDGKLPFASVAWAGMAGVVTGINAAGIYISINAARTNDKAPASGGLPVELLVRRALEEARSIDDVVALVKRTPVLVPDFYLVGDGKTGESAVIERSPTRIEVRRTGGHGDTSIVTNHALSPAFAGDAENDRLRRYLTSGARYDRLDELVKHLHGQIDPRRALEILRDKHGVGGKVLGLGHRNALDALIATHSVVVDATNLIVWVGEGPHALGRYRAFDLRRELLGETRPTPVDLPADPLADGDEVRDAQLATLSMAAALRQRSEHRLDRALDEARRAAALDPLLPEPHMLLGDLLQKSDPATARAEYERFLQLDPPYLADAERVRGLLLTLPR